MKTNLLLFIALCSLMTISLSAQIIVDPTNSNGVRVVRSGGDGMLVDSARFDGIQLWNSGDNGVEIFDTGNNGVRIDAAGTDGVSVGSATRYGLRVINAGTNALRIDNSGSNGIQIDDAGQDGIRITTAFSDAIEITNPDDDGVEVLNCGDDALSVFNAGGDGLFVSRATNWSANIQGVKNLAASPSGHIAQIYNRSTGNSADVLALKVGFSGNPGAAQNFISFFNGNDAAIGRIDGNGSGGVAYGTTGGDFAECLTPYTEDEQFEAGDVVGVFDGRISHRTQGASNIMVITDRPAVLGNQDLDAVDQENVSFIGQVDVKVWGPVASGDWIVVSDRADGTALAVAPDEIEVHHQIVGRAWEANSEVGLKRVNTAVGLDQSKAMRQILDHALEEQQIMKHDMAELKAQYADLASKYQALMERISNQ